MAETLAAYMNSQFSAVQNIDFFIRVLVAGLCGALIGIERTRRFKDAGIRTHIIVCCASALMMIVSKYGFVDMVTLSGNFYDGTKGADASRIASQVVSGISFLGAGVIFKHGSAVRGLTTAAGLWATSGIGLAIGAGMYPIGVFTTILMVVVQALMHKYVMGADSMSISRLQFTVRGGGDLQEALDGFITNHRVQITDTKISYLEDGFISYDVVLRLPKEISVMELAQFFRSHGELRNISVTPIT